MHTRNYTFQIKQMAHQLGFDFCGIAKAEKLDEDARRLEQWLQKGYHGKMSYMENHFDLRTNPQLLVPGAQSVITLLYNYYPEQISNNQEVSIAKYAYGDDYHDIIRAKLRLFLQEIQKEIGSIEGRGFVDSAPVLERTWAQKSGLGWIGKNANLINKQHGSFFFIATLIIDFPLEYDDPYSKDYCGTCTRCIDACPTEAIVSPTVIDGSKCISYLTIELKDELIPDAFQGKMNNWVFGCDICQDVCPWNRFAQVHDKPELQANETMLAFSVKDWLEIEETHFNTLLKHSPIKRTKWKGIRRNVTFLQHKKNDRK